MPEGTIVVTGASRGIGEAIARALSQSHFTTACLSRSGAAPVGRGYPCDVTDEADVARTIADIAEYGPIIGLVNNAGQHEDGEAATLGAADFNRLMEMNATSVLIVSRETHPHLKAAGGGLIVNMGSFFDKLGVAGSLAYCASKAAVASITRCLAVEWAKDGIRTINVAPGYIETDLNRDFLVQESVIRWIERRIPAGRVGQPDEVAKLVRALFDANIPFLTGETIYVDGGQGMNH